MPNGTLIDLGVDRKAERAEGPVRLDAAMRERVDRFYRAGLARMPDAGSWYADTFFNIQNILTVYDDSREPDRDDSDARAFLFVDLLAATSPQASIKRNTFLATQVFQFIRDGLLCGMKIAFEAHLNNVCRALLGLKLSGPKVQAFQANLLNDQNMVTVDTWMMRVFGRRTLVPSDREYEEISRATRTLAREYNTSPSAMQAILWVGIKALDGDPNDTPEPFEKTLEKFISRQTQQGEFEFMASPGKFEREEDQLKHSAGRPVAANPGFSSPTIVGPRMKEICAKESNVDPLLVDVICVQPEGDLMEAILFVREHMPSWLRRKPSESPAILLKDFMDQPA